MHDQYIISQNHQNLRKVVETTAMCTHDKNVRAMATKLLDNLHTDKTRTVGISVDRGLPFVGYAKTADTEWSTDARKVATLNKFYVKYVDAAASASNVDLLVANVAAQAERLGYTL